MARRGGIRSFYVNKTSAARNSEVPADLFSSPVVGLHSVGRFISGRFCRVCLGTGEFLRPQGAIPPGLYPLRGGWVYCLAPEGPQKGECRRGRRYFWPCRTRVGFGPATGPTLKTALCHVRALVGRFDKYRGPRGRSRAFVCGLSSPVLGLHSVGRLTSGRFCRVCLGTGDFLRPKGAIPPGFYPLVPYSSAL